MVAALSIPVSNISQLLGLGFTRIEVWSSTDLGNSYQEITSASPAPAVLVSEPARTTFRMGGRLLTLSVDGGPSLSVSFGSVLDLWTPAQVAVRINEVFSGLATVSQDGKSIVLTSPTSGRASVLRILYDDAHDLGLRAGVYAYGTGPRITLAGGTVLYSFSDPYGIPGLTRYKWRFSANGVSPISEFADRVFGLSSPVDPSLISVATASFLGLNGIPKKTTVIVVMDESPRVVAGFVAGSDLPTSFVSNDLGFLQIPLLRGMKVRVAIEGTALVREITVPDASSFDLLAAMNAVPDQFTVQATVPLLSRRSL